MYASPSLYPHGTRIETALGTSTGLEPEGQSGFSDNAKQPDGQDAGKATHNERGTSGNRAPTAPVITTRPCPPISKLGRERSRYSSCAKKAAQYQVRIIQLRTKIQDREDELTAMLEQEEELLAKFGTWTSRALTCKAAVGPGFRDSYYQIKSYTSPATSVESMQVSPSPQPKRRKLATGPAIKKEPDCIRHLE